MFCLLALTSATAFADALSLSASSSSSSSGLLSPHAATEPALEESRVSLRGEEEGACIAAADTAEEEEEEEESEEDAAATTAEAKACARGEEPTRGKIIGARALGGKDSVEGEGEEVLLCAEAGATTTGLGLQLLC